MWHYQLVHHDLWDYDLPAAPVLGDITVDGKPIKAVMQITKHGFLFVFDRVTGEPVWPIEERPVPASTTPGETAWPTQPFPTKPAPFDRLGVTVDDLIDFTPELRAEGARDSSKPYVPSGRSSRRRRWRLRDIPWVRSPLPSASGAGNWNGGAFDPETGIFYVASHTHPWINDLIRPPPVWSEATDAVHPWASLRRSPRLL